MKLSHRMAWDRCLSFIQAELADKPQTFVTWFKPIRSVDLQDKVLTIQVPNPFFYEWIEENYLDLLSRALQEVLGPGIRLEYRFRSSPNGEASGQYENANQVNVQEIKNPFVIPGIKRVKIDSQLNRRYTFENFVEGDCNRLARSAGVAIADRPGKTSFNPLFVFGDVGLGKTHLAQAIGNRISEKHPDRSVLYMTTEQFMNQTINAIKKGDVENMLNFYLSLDVLIVDDVQFMEGKMKLQEIFFNIFNRLHHNDKQIILTSDRAPKDLEGIKDRIISRFKWGLSADLQVPDLETRIAIFERKMEEHDVVASRQVVQYICHNINQNVRELEGVLVSLVAESSINNQAIDLQLAKKVVRNFITDIRNEITVDGIIEVVSEHYNLEAQMLRSKSRKRQVVLARQMAIFLSKELTQHSYKEIGLFFGGRDHSTMIHSCNTIRDLTQSDPSVHAALQTLTKKVQMGVHV